MSFLRRAAVRALALTVAAALLLGACGGGSEDASETTTTSTTPTTAATTTTTAAEGAYEIGGYRLEPVDPAAIGFEVPAGTVTAVTAFRVSKGGREIAAVVQAFLPESETPSDETLLEVLAQVTTEVGGEPTETAIGDSTGYVVTTDAGKVVIGSLQEDASLRFAFGADKDEMLQMLDDLSTAQPGAS